MGPSGWGSNRQSFEDLVKEKALDIVADVQQIARDRERRQDTHAMLDAAKSSLARAPDAALQKLCDHFQARNGPDYGSATPEYLERLICARYDEVCAATDTLITTRDTLLELKESLRPSAGAEGSRADDGGGDP